MSIRCKSTILRAKVLEKMKHLLYYAHYCNPTRSIQENKKRIRKAKDAATAERLDTLERALQRAHKTGTTNNNFSGPLIKISAI